MTTRKHLENFLETNGDKKEFCILLLRYECVNCIFTTNFNTNCEIHLFLLTENIKECSQKSPLKNPEKTSS